MVKFSQASLVMVLSTQMMRFEPYLWQMVSHQQLLQCLIQTLPCITGCQKYVKKNSGIIGHKNRGQLRDGKIFTIPLRSREPKGCQYLLLAGFCEKAIFFKRRPGISKLTFALSSGLTSKRFIIQTIQAYFSAVLLKVGPIFFKFWFISSYMY